MEKSKFSIKPRYSSSLLLLALSLFVQKPVYSESPPSRNAHLLESMGVSEVLTDEQKIEVFVIDTGVLRNNEQINDSIVDESCFSFENKCEKGQSVSTSPYTRSNCQTSIDNCLHGTAVTSIFADNGVKIHFVQIFSADDAIKALENIAKNEHNWGSIVNMSIGFDPLDSEDCTWRLPRWQKVMNQLVANNITLTVPAGNRQHKNSVLWPCCVSASRGGQHQKDGVIVVSATDKDQNLASYSSFSPSFTSISAPGTVQVYWDKGWVEANGTSFATPLIAIGLLGVQNELSLTPDSLEHALRSTAIQRFDSALQLPYLFGRFDLLRNRTDSNQVYLSQVISP